MAKKSKKVEEVNFVRVAVIVGIVAVILIAAMFVSVSITGNVIKQNNNAFGRYNLYTKEEVDRLISSVSGGSNNIHSYLTSLKMVDAPNESISHQYNNDVKYYYPFLTRDDKIDLRDLGYPGYTLKIIRITENVGSDTGRVTLELQNNGVAVDLATIDEGDTGKVLYHDLKDISIKVIIDDVSYEVTKSEYFCNIFIPVISCSLTCSEEFGSKCVIGILSEYLNPYTKNYALGKTTFVGCSFNSLKLGRLSCLCEPPADPAGSSGWN